MELYDNPRVPVDHNGIQQLQKTPLYAAPILVNIDSQFRGTSYTSPSNFTIRLNQSMRGICSIELINAIIPVPNPVPGNYLYLIAEVGNHNLRLFTVGTSTNVDTVDSATDGSIGDQSFAKIMMDNVILGVAYWKRSEVRYIKRFNPAIEEMGTMRIRLVDKTGNVYDIGDNNDISLTFEIVKYG